MTKCVECGKQLGFFEGYYHPTLGKNSLVCSSCFDKVTESIAQWREFILAHSFNTESSSQRVDWHAVFARFTRRHMILNSPKIEENLHTAELTLRCKGGVHDPTNIEKNRLMIP
jgi:hypothetical protein